MIDAYVLLTPVLLLGVVSLLVFVGCDIVLGLKRLDTPQGVTATTRSQRVDLTWVGHSDAEEYFVYRHQGTANPVKIGTVPKTTTSYRDTDGLVDGMEYLYAVSFHDGDEEGPKSNPPIKAIPNPIAFVETIMLTTARNDFTGFVGMGIQVGSEDLDVVQLGRPFGLGNTRIHKIKIVDAANNAEVGSVMLDTNQLPRSIGDFQYTQLAQKVTLTAGRIYYILSQETNGQDQFYRHDAVVTTTDVASLVGAFFEQTPGMILQDETPPRIYPVDFKY